MAAQFKCKKCQVVSFGRDVNQDCVYTMLHNENCTSISREDVVRDLGVMLTKSLTLENIYIIRLIWHIKWLD